MPTNVWSASTICSSALRKKSSLNSANDNLDSKLDCIDRCRCRQSNRSLVRPQKAVDSSDQVVPAEPTFHRVYSERSGGSCCCSATSGPAKPVALAYFSRISACRSCVPRSHVSPAYKTIGQLLRPLFRNDDARLAALVQDVRSHSRRHTCPKHNHTGPHYNRL